MKIVFADTQHFIATVDQRDQWHKAAFQAVERLGPHRIVTTEEVLVEFLNAFSKAGQYLRIMAAKTVRGLLEDPNVTVVPQTRTSFKRGLALYESRPDKNYSLTDCISMRAMEDRGIQEILTFDHHFEQHGFICLLIKAE